MLKQSFLAKVYSTLEKSPFTIADFSVEQGNDEEETVILTVRFRHHSEYVFQVQEHEGSLFAIEAPGTYKRSETVSLPTLHGLPDRLANWARNVRDELRSQMPVYEEVDELRKVIEKHLAEHVTDPDAPFTKAEADDLRAKLDALSSRFVELAEHSEITKQELNRVQQELTAIKANLTSFPKGTWYKTAGTKLWSVTSKVLTSAESRQVIAQAARKLIGLNDPP